MKSAPSLPLIGITLDSEEAGGYSKFPWYALRQNYCEAVTMSGGLPMALPHEPDLVTAYLAHIDGLIVTGGAFDVDPALFGDSSRHATVILKERRTRFELSIVREALARDLPILGICGGQQLLNVALGGTLIQHIPDTVADCLAHEQPNPRNEPGHSVALAAGSLLQKIAQTDTIMVNSAHHQAVATTGPGVLVNATAPDGVIEGIEVPDKRFCMGVQWHPEFHISAADKALFAAFIESCRR